MIVSGPTRSLPELHCSRLHVANVGLPFLSDNIKIRSAQITAPILRYSLCNRQGGSG